uniref:Uncharacterized protein n=1 Tax=Tetranychus urticae TaxID=32264 RepID=T1JZ86_TETUR
MISLSRQRHGTVNVCRKLSSFSSSSHSPSTHLTPESDGIATLHSDGRFKSMT